MAKSPGQEHPKKAFGWAARDTSGVLSPFSFSNRAPGDEDATFRVFFCGIYTRFLKAAKNTMDSILDSVSAVHPILPLIDLLKSRGKLFLLDAPEKPLVLPVFPLLIGRKMIAGSAIGGTKETPEMIGFAAKHNMTAYTDVISMKYVNTTMDVLRRVVLNTNLLLILGTPWPPHPRRPSFFLNCHGHFR